MTAETFNKYILFIIALGCLESSDGSVSVQVYGSDVNDSAWTCGSQITLSCSMQPNGSYMYWNRGSDLKAECLAGLCTNYDPLSYTFTNDTAKGIYNLSLHSVSHLDNNISFICSDGIDFDFKTPLVLNEELAATMVQNATHSTHVTLELQTTCAWQISSTWYTQKDDTSEKKMYQPERLSMITVDCLQNSSCGKSGTRVYILSIDVEILQECEAVYLIAEIKDIRTGITQTVPSLLKYNICTGGVIVICLVFTLPYGISISLCVIIIIGIIQIAYAIAIAVFTLFNLQRIEGMWAKVIYIWTSQALPADTICFLIRVHSDLDVDALRVLEMSDDNWRIYKKSMINQPWILYITKRRQSTTPYRVKIQARDTNEGYLCHCEISWTVTGLSATGKDTGLQYREPLFGYFEDIRTDNTIVLAWSNFCTWTKTYLLNCSEEDNTLKRLDVTNTAKDWLIYCLDNLQRGSNYNVHVSAKQERQNPKWTFKTKGSRKFMMEIVGQPTNNSVTIKWRSTEGGKYHVVCTRDGEENETLLYANISKMENDWTVDTFTNLVSASEYKASITSGGESESLSELRFVTKERNYGKLIVGLLLIGVIPIIGIITVAIATVLIYMRLNNRFRQCVSKEATLVHNSTNTAIQHQMIDTRNKKRVPDQLSTIVPIVAREETNF